MDLISPIEKYDHLKIPGGRQEPKSNPSRQLTVH